MSEPVFAAVHIAASWWAPVLAAPFVGSLAGVLAVRLPRRLPVAMARSACDSCHHVLGPLELVPIVSYGLQRGRCRQCGAAIGLLPLGMELGAVAIAVWSALSYSGLALWSSCVLGWMLLALAVADWTSFRLPNKLTLPLLAFGLLATFGLWKPAVADHAMAALVAYAGLRVLAFAFRRLRGREGLGGGDAKLLAAGGAWLGTDALPYVLLIAGLSGLVLAAFYFWRTGMSTRAPVPFGPSLAFAIWMCWLYG